MLGEKKVEKIKIVEKIYKKELGELKGWENKNCWINTKYWVYYWI